MDVETREKILANAYETLCEAKPGSAAYKNAWDVIKTFQREEMSFWESLDPNSILSMIGSFALALLVLYYEKTDIIRSRAWALLPKLWR